MSELTPSQQRLREQFEGLIGAAAPFLDLVLGVGDRISRASSPRTTSTTRCARAPRRHALDEHVARSKAEGELAD